jgi:hypothetical protein
MMVKHILAEKGADVFTLSATRLARKLLPRLRNTISALLSLPDRI